jgi:NADH-quinone oxidoreductase subunit M
MGYVLLGVASGKSIGLRGAVLQLISHSLSSAALFFCAGSLYMRFKTHNIDDFKGVKRICPKFSVFFLLTVAASIAFPGTSGFIAKFFIILSNISKYPIVAFCGALGMFLTPCYMLLLYKKVFSGDEHLPQKIQDLSFEETTVLTCLLFAVFILGIIKIPIIS